MSDKKETIVFVEFGRGGDTAHVEGGKARIEGYGRPDRPHAGDRCERYLIPDGTPALNKIPAIDTDEGFSWVFEGPMVNVALKPGEVSRCPDLNGSIVAQTCIAAGNGYGQVAALQVAHNGGDRKKEPGPLDSVDVETYIRGWVARGAVVGHYEGGRIVWEGAD